MSIRLARAIVTIAASFVPADERVRWREEWLGEIESRQAEGANHPRRVLRAALGAPRDALSVRFMKTRDKADGRWLARTLPHLIDFKLAARVARSTPLLSLTAVSALAVGIALATTAFTLVKMALYSQLYTTDGAPVMALEDYDRVGRWDLPITLKEFDRRRRLLTSFADVAGYTQRAASVSLNRQDEVRPVGFVTANTFRLLGVPPLAGRDFGDTDARSGAGAAALIGEQLARLRFPSIDDALGQVVLVNGQAYTIVGVIPATCRFPFDADLWITLRTSLAPATSPDSAVKVVGRLKPRVSPETAEAELVAVASQVPPVRGEERTQRVIPFGSLARGREAHLVGWSVVAGLVLLLLVSAANVANLLLARAATRERELSVRIALGASRSRIMTGLVAEAALLGGVAALLGFVGARAALFALQQTENADMPYWVTLKPDPVVVFFVIAVASIASLCASVGPAWRLTRRSPVAALVSRGSTIRFGRLSTVLIVSETALAIGLLTWASLLGRGLLEFGYHAYRLPEDRLLIAQLYFGAPSVPRDPSEDSAARRAVWQRYLIDVRSDQRTLADRLRAIAGVRLVAYGWQFPGGDRFTAPVEIERPGGHSEVVTTRVAETGENYFAALNATIVQGRDFTRADFETGAAIAIVNEPFARRCFRGLNPVGQRIKIQRQDRADEWREIVGVVPDLALNPADPARGDGVYAPAAPSNVVRVAVLADTEPMRFLPVIHDLARGLPLRPQVQWAHTLGEQMAEPVALFRILGIGFVSLGTVALLLSCTGIHAIVAFSLAQRRRELAVRMALGAGATTLARALLGRTIRQLALGAIGGVLVALLIARLLDVLPFDVPQGDAWLVVMMSFVLTGAGTLACAAPLKRALELRPLDWLRDS